MNYLIVGVVALLIMYSIINLFYLIIEDEE